MNVLLHGGGLDSSALFLKMIEQNVDFECFHIDYCHVAAFDEFKSINYQCNKYGIKLNQRKDYLIKALNPKPNLLFGDKVDNYYLESRNIVLLTHLLDVEYVESIYMGIDKPVNGVPLPDCSLEFIKAAYDSFGKKIIAPFINTDKIEFCKDAYNFDEQFFDFSMTCWCPIDHKECGSCKHCLTKSAIKSQIAF